MRRFFFAVLSGVLVTAPAQAGPNPLLDWKTWTAYRTTVQHPCLGIKAGDIQRARANVKTYPWAKQYVDDLTTSVTPFMARINPEWIESMIPATTPVDRVYTPCPACRDLGKPLSPHGTWTWHPDWKDKIRCSTCGTVFPNPKYPESVVMQTKWGKPSTLTFYGGEPFTIFGRVVRPSFTGNIRARKVEWMAAFARKLSELYGLTGDVQYARPCRQILLRFADVYPYYLVHSGYGDFADMDPKVAALNVGNLPQDDLSYPPLVPDRKLHTNYWSAGRASGVGMEGVFVRKVVEAYDLTCTAVDGGTPLYSDEERKHIEQDLLLESTALLVGDRLLNNKSVGNRTAAALVGICCGHPGLVRFGMDGFKQTVESYFLPDGATPESSAYALMALDGLIDLPQAMRGYSDPPNYSDMYNRRYDNMDLYKDPSFGKVWRTLYNTLQGDLKYPPLADSYLSSSLTPRLAQLMIANYGAELNCYGLAAEKPDPETAIYLAEPTQATANHLSLRFTDMLFPNLGQGYFRTGADGRESLAVLNASQWGVHHHLDSLGLYYWKDGQELLSDLGYLWDHPRKEMTVRTFAHNLVMIDEKDQVGKDRGGEYEFYLTGPHAKAMRARSKAYPDATTYERTEVLVDHGAAGSYLVDFFQVQGGKTQDYVIHGPNRDFRTSDLTLSPSETPLYDLVNVRQGAEGQVPSLTWKLDGGQEFSAYFLPERDEKFFVGDGWGQRDSKNSDMGASLPYVIRRTEGGFGKTFPAVYESHKIGAPLVLSVKKVNIDHNEDIGARAIQVETSLGNDVIVFSPKDFPTTSNVHLNGGPGAAMGGKLETAGVAVVNFSKAKVDWTFSSAKSPITLNGKLVSAPVAAP